jgi:diguanylate cyclase (GGDEF)-like protein
MSRKSTICLDLSDEKRTAAWNNALQDAGLRTVVAREFAASADEASADEASADEASADEASADEASADEASADEATAPSPAPQLREVAVLVTDSFAALDRFPLARRQRGEIGVILIGTAGPADVQLPLDATSRELVLACKLLAQIVNMRQEMGRQQRQGRILRELAATDALTGLANRRGWEDMLAQLQTNAGDSAVSRVLVLLDVDRFKEHNDQLGHTAADRYLVEIARRLMAATRRGDFLARWGGDEFALLLNHVQAEQARTVVERIRQAAIGSAPAGQAVPATVSAGWAMFEPSGKDLDTAALFREADEALQAAKRAGRNCTRPE